MSQSNAPNSLVGQEILKERPCFDFYVHAYRYLLWKANSNNFIRYHMVYQYACRNFKLPKRTVKLLLTELEQRGMIRKEKRGIRMVT